MSASRWHVPATGIGIPPVWVAAIPNPDINPGKLAESGGSFPHRRGIILRPREGKCQFSLFKLGMVGG